MSVEIFRTTVPVQPADNKITYKSFSLLLGSCFTENIGNKLLGYKLPVIVNPFGITYNPLSVKKCLERIISGNPYQLSELNERGRIYFSFDHHSRFSDPDPDICLEKINKSFIAAREKIREAGYLFITFGTSYYYALKSTNSVVSNCHKLPDKEFRRQRLSVASIVEEYRDLIPKLFKTNPGLKIVFTVSPIRHWKDGAHENQLSKSILLLAIDELSREFDNIDYFPAYELMMDELRDYRFYEEDMLHPNKTAIAFIWKRFLDCYTDKETQKVMAEVDKIQLAREHRPFNTTSELFAKFVQQQLHKINQLSGNLPGIDFTKEIQYFTSFLK